MDKFYIEIIDINTREKVLIKSEQVHRIPVKCDFLDLHSLSIDITDYDRYSKTPYCEVIAVTLTNYGAEVYINTDNLLEEIKY